MTPQGAETQRRNNLLRRFGTTDILEILGSAGTIPPTQSIANRLAEFGINHTKSKKWAETYIPPELYAQLLPYQLSLRTKHQQDTLLTKYGVSNVSELESVKQRRLATFDERYGGNPMKNPEIKAHYDSVIESKYGGHSPFCSDTVQAKRKATCTERFGGVSPFCSAEVREARNKAWSAKYAGGFPVTDPTIQQKIADTNAERYGGHPASLSVDEMLNRLSRYQLEPLEPLIGRSDANREIKVRCKLCGREFATRWTNSNNATRGYSGHGLVVCECQTHGAKLEWFARDYVRDNYYPSAYQWSRIDWLDNREIDIYIPDEHIGFEINGYHSHNSTLDPYTKGPGKSSEYHRWKSAKCLEHGIKLYHFWYDTDTPENRDRAMAFIDAVLRGERLSVSPGDKLNRDSYPDPSEAGLPYTELPPEPFETPSGICFNSGFWQF